MSLPFAALADPTRQRIVELLAGGEQPVYRIARGFDMSRPAVSQHLRVLLRAGLLRERKVGRERLYSLRPAVLQSVADWASRYAALGQPHAAATLAGLPAQPPLDPHAAAPSPASAPRRPRIRSLRQNPPPAP